MPPSVAGRDRRKENADRGSEEIRDNLGFLPTMLLVFGFIAVFVGSFLIFNTFSITVAQRVTRVRDAAHARRLAAADPHHGPGRGGSRSACSARCIGIAGGFLVALVLNALFEAFGIDLPTTDLVLETRTVVVSLLVGVGRHPRLLADPGAALDPGAADRRPACLRADAQPTPPAALRRSLSVLLGLAGLAMLLGGLLRRRRRRGERRGLMGGGAVVIVLAVSLFSPRLVRPLAAIAGWPLERVRRLTRAPRPRERPAQPEPHRGHRGGADDRPRPGHLRHRLRRRPEELGRPGGRRKLRRRPGDPEQRRLLADPERRPPPPPAKCPGVELVATIRSAQAKLVERRRRCPGHRPRPDDIEEAVEVEWKQGGPAALRDLARRRGDPRRLLRLRQRPRSRRHASGC